LRFFASLPRFGAGTAIFCVCPATAGPGGFGAGAVAAVGAEAGGGAGGAAPGGAPPGFAPTGAAGGLEVGRVRRTVSFDPGFGGRFIGCEGGFVPGRGGLVGPEGGLVPGRGGSAIFCVSLA
jgi:hypothetical protein